MGGYDMIKQRFHIYVKGQKWNITAFYPVTRYHVEEIIDSLYQINCNEEDLKKAYINITSDNVNNGLTFSNYFYRESVIIFAISISPAKYFNLITHELHHLSVHIAVSSGFNLQGEEVCYINGDIAEMMFPVVVYLLCKGFIRNYEIKYYVR